MSTSAQATKQLSAIPFGSLIGGPLNAAVEAQSQSAITTLKFVLGALYGKDAFGSASQTYLIGGEENSPDGTGESDQKPKQPEVVQLRLFYQAESGKSEINVPLITVLPIPYIEITEMNITFDANITAMSKESTSKEENTDSNASGSLTAGLFGAGINLNASYSADTKSSSKTKSELSTDYKVHVDLKAANKSMPEGMSRILRMLNDGIKVNAVEVNAVEVNAEEAP